MEKSKDIQGGGIVFGDWKLFPMDDRNWELCHRHTGKARGRNDAGTEPRWYRQGRFYQYNTIDLALLYAADCEMKDGREDEAKRIMDALKEYRAIVEKLTEDIREALGNE